MINMLDGSRERLKIWFREVHPWVPYDTLDSRLVWLQCYGVPLQIWNQRFFRVMAELSGDFVEIDTRTVDKSQLEVGRVRICTSEIHRPISHLIKVLVGKENFLVSIKEEDGGCEGINGGSTPVHRNICGSWNEGVSVRVVNLHRSLDVNRSGGLLAEGVAGSTQKAH